MTYEVLVPAIGITWLLIGLALALVMARRGQPAFTWFVMGTLMGPLAIAFAIDEVRHGSR